MKLHPLTVKKKKKKLDTIQSGTNSRITYKQHKTKYSKSQRIMNAHTTIIYRVYLQLVQGPKGYVKWLV